MLKPKKPDGEKGMSIIEILPLVIVMTTLFSFLLGAWGIAHKNILTSIGSRTYAFETFNYRANLVYFNDTRSESASYEATESRFHGAGYRNPSDFSAPIVPIRYVANQATANAGSPTLHRQDLRSQAQYERGQEIQQGPVNQINHVWVTIGYGICINANCGGN